MIDILANEDVDKVIKRVDMSKAILIAGEANNGYAANRISYYDSPKKALEDYGECDLSESIRVAKDLGAQHVFAINVRKKHDYIQLIPVFRQYEFAYIVPINIRFSDFFYDSNRENKKITYVRDYLERASHLNHSTYLMTDRHASLYEDIDQFLDEMLSYVDTTKSQIVSPQKGRNLCFVANNLHSYKYANVVLGAVLANTDTPAYPKINSHEKVIFDIDYTDVGEREMVYFKSNFLTGACIENLVNFDKPITTVKFVVTDRIVKHIQRTLDLSHFHGKPYTAYQKVSVRKSLEDYLDALVGWSIRDYKIESIQFFKENTGVGSIECRFDIWPVSSIEKYSVIIE